MGKEGAIVTIALKTFYDFSEITHRIVSALLCLDKLGPVEKPAPTRFKLLHLEEYLSFPIKDGLSFLEKEIIIRQGALSPVLAEEPQIDLIEALSTSPPFPFYVVVGSLFSFLLIGNLRQRLLSFLSCPHPGLLIYQIPEVSLTYCRGRYFYSFRSRDWWMRQRLLRECSLYIGRLRKRLCNLP